MNDYERMADLIGKLRRNVPKGIYGGAQSVSYEQGYHQALSEMMDEITAEHIKQSIKTVDEDTDE